ncbi:MAG: hypothetical protein QXD48_02815 [Candidatus Aenigmatarchaeota archaeon]
MNRGITLPTNMIIIIILAVLVLIVLSAYFISTSGTSMSTADANRIFSKGCLRYCKSDVEKNYVNAYYIPETDKEFMAACERLGYGNREYPNRCLEKCGHVCDMQATDSDVNNRFDQIVSNLKR